MVRNIKKCGVSITLLPPPIPPEEEVLCRKCQLDYDLSEKRRTCRAACGHELCMECMLRVDNLRRPCEECTSDPAPTEEEGSAETERKNIVDDNRPQNTQISA